jgi:predicted RNA-binding protein with RPS1 domain
MQGYIKDHRKELNSDIWLMPPLYHRVWQWLKYRANHNDALIPMSDGTKLGIKKGQHLTSVRKIARGVGYYTNGLWEEPNPKTIQNILKWLVKNNMITIQNGNKDRQYTLITILNWESYQADETGTKPAAPKKTEGKKDKVKYPEGNSYLNMANYFYKRVSAVAKQEGIEHLTIRADMQKWADEMRKLVEINKVDKQLAKDVMDWVTQDNFWKTNILSAKKLREKFTDLAIKMKTSSKPKQQYLQQQPRTDSRDKDIEFQRWVENGGDPDAFDWGK